MAIHYHAPAASYHTQAMNTLHSTLESLQDEDLVLALFILQKGFSFNNFNAYIQWNTMDCNNILSNVCQRLNSIKHLKEIRQIILDCCSPQNESFILNYEAILKISINTCPHRSRDLGEYKSNQRLFMLALYIAGNIIYNNGQHNQQITMINNHFFRFLVLILCCPILSHDNGLFDYIEQTYSQVINKHFLHFGKYDNPEFYRWAKDYMDQRDNDYHSKQFNPTNDEEYKVIVNHIFDVLFIQNEKLYDAMKEPLLKAYYQKGYRQKNKGKKALYFALTKRTQEALETLSRKWNMSQEKVLDKLINKCYTEECTDSSGNSMY